MNDLNHDEIARFNARFVPAYAVGDRVVVRSEAYYKSARGKSGTVVQVDTIYRETYHFGVELDRFTHIEWFCAEELKPERKTEP